MAATPATAPNQAAPSRSDGSADGLMTATRVSQPLPYLGRVCSRSLIDDSCRCNPGKQWGRSGIASARGVRLLRKQC